MKDKKEYFSISHPSAVKNSGIQHLSPANKFGNLFLTSKTALSFLICKAH